MESLLRWGIENSSPGDTSQPAPQTRKDLDPAIIDAILGKSDAELMKEDLAVATDNGKDEDTRIEALDHMEMLIEQIDNANNLEKLKMWESLHSLLSSSSEGIVMQALWVIGTAVQNNPAAQDAYLKLEPLPDLTAFLAPGATSLKVRSKVIYVLSGLLKHNAPAVHAMDELESEGWPRLRDALQDPEISVRRKTVFLLNTLLIPNNTSSSTSQASTSTAVHQDNPVHANSHAAHLTDSTRADTSPLVLKALKSHQVLRTVIDGLVDPIPYGEDGDRDEPDHDFEEKSVRLLATYLVDCGQRVDTDDVLKVGKWIEKKNADDLGMAAEDLEILKNHLKQ